MMSRPRLTFRRKYLLAVFALLVAPAASIAQTSVGDPGPAHIASVDGAADVERDGISEPATVNSPFVPGDRLRTAAGRVELWFPDGSALDVDEYSVVELQAPALLRLSSGRVLFFVSGVTDPAAATRYQIDTPAASARTDGPGEYRISALNGRAGAETELAVRRGSASLETERGSMPIGAGEWTVARDGEEPAYAHVFNSARYDAFDAWALELRDARTTAASTEYLPQDLRMYGSTFDREGSWEYTDSYGYVWYPTVASEWRPYYHGYWAAYPRWGWTWIGLDRWAWPTHHYGRWGVERNRWFWIPGRSWSAAWVSWASAPGYVSWCPLGFDGRPVAAFTAASTAWTIVPRRTFGAFDRVDRYAVPAHTIPAAAFVAHRTPPVQVPRTPSNVTAMTPGIAVPRPAGVGSRESGVGSRESPGGRREPNVTPRPAAAAAKPPEYAIPRPSMPGVSTPDPRLPTADSRAIEVPRVPRASTPASGLPATDSRAIAVPRAPTPPTYSAPSSGSVPAHQAAPRSDPAPHAPAAPPTPSPSASPRTGGVAAPPAGAARTPAQGQTGRRQ